MYYRLYLIIIIQSLNKLSCNKYIEPYGYWIYGQKAIVIRKRMTVGTKLFNTNIMNLQNTD